jgi:hypothetical protein
MQLMPVVDVPCQETSMPQTTKTTEELFLSILEALAGRITAIPDGISAECPERPELFIEPQLPEEEGKEPLELAWALMGMLATPVFVPTEPAEQLELTFPAQSIAPATEPMALDAMLFEFLEQLEDSQLKLPEKIVVELEKLAWEVQRESSLIDSMATVEPPGALQTSQQEFGAILNTLFQTPEPAGGKPLVFALFPEQEAGELQSNQILSVEPQAEAARVPKPLVYFLPLVQDEKSKEPFIELPHFSWAVEIPEEKATIKSQTEDSTSGGFVLAQRSSEPVASKLEAPPLPWEPPFQEIMTKATVRVGAKIQELAVKIQPQSLGKVMMRVALEEGQLVAKFLTESNQAKGILELNIPQLRESLAKEGLVLEHCEVATAWSQEFGNKDRQEQKEQQPRRALHYEEHFSQHLDGEIQVGLVNFLA